MSANIEAIEIETAPHPTSSVIWLHGLGADGYDFVPVVEELDLAGLAPIRFIFPHAPMRPITVNGGMVMRGWYDITSIDFDTRREDESGIRASAAILERFVARENERGIADRRIVLAGFSQGGAIVLHGGLRHPRRLAGIIALSTYLPLASTLVAECAQANRDVPLFMAHGLFDAVIPFDLGANSHELLLGGGYRVEWHQYQMDHAVCDEEINDIGAWLRRVLPMEEA